MKPPKFKSSLFLLIFGPKLQNDLAGIYLQVAFWAFWSGILTFESPPPNGWSKLQLVETGAIISAQKAIIVLRPISKTGFSAQKNSSKHINVVILL